MSEEKQILLDLGSGTTKPAGYIGIDKVQFGNTIDIVMNLDDLNVSLGFGDDSVDEIRASHFLEHVVNLFPLMNECWRILKPEGKFEIFVPLGYTAAFGDPTHVRAFSEESFHYFLKENPGNQVNPELKGFWKIIKNDWTDSMEEDNEKIITHKRRELHVILTPNKDVIEETKSE